MENEPHTTVRAGGGLIEYEASGTKARRVVLDPPHPSPQKSRERYELPGWLLGKLEVLAQSRFEVGEFMQRSPDQLRVWTSKDEPYILSIVRSVNASSRIEGEGVHARDVPVVLHAVTRSLGQTTSELKDRQLALKDISQACLWALREMRHPILSYDLVLEIHKRMFNSTKPKIAGTLKTEPIFISDDEKRYFNVETLPPEKTEKFLRALCERFSHSFHDAERFSSHSKLVLVAEFLVDFLAIHPFEDGNGRTARLLSTYLLERAGYHFARFYPLDQVILDARNRYFDALFAAQSRWYQPDEDLLPWFEFRSPSTALHGAYSYPDETLLTALSLPQKAGCVP